MSHASNHWYFSAVGNLGHKFHTPIDEEHQQLNKKDCDKEDVDLMQVMYSVDTLPATIAKIMSAVRRKTNQTGYFISNTLHKKYLYQTWKYHGSSPRIRQELEQKGNEDLDA